MVKNLDILLFHGTDFFPSWLIEMVTGSRYSHVAIILDNPTYIQQSLKGVFMLESGEEPTPNAATGHVKWGVQLQWWDWILQSYPGQVYKRSLHWNVNPDDNINDKLLDAWEISKHAPYDLNVVDLLEAEFNMVFDRRGQITSEFVCSAYLTFILSKIGALPSSVQWDSFSPSNFIPGGRIDYELKKHGKAMLGPVVQIK